MENLPIIKPQGYELARIEQYMSLQKEIRSVIKGETTDQPDKKIIDDVVDSIGELAKDPGYKGLIQAIVNIFTGNARRKRLAKIIENILGKIFDISTQKWYAVDYDDLKETCNRYGGNGYFKKEDHHHIYTIIIQELKHGPLRDKCIEIGATKYINEKLEAIQYNFEQFKIKEY